MKDHPKPFGYAGRAAAGLIIAATAFAAQPAASTPASGFTAVQQWKGDYGPIEIKTKGANDWEVELKTDGSSDVHVVRNAIAINGQSGWHRHPGPSLITVTVGSITAYDSTDPLCSPTVYQAGEGFIDHGDHAHLLRNESGAPAETVAVQFLSDGATRRIDEPAPSHCSF